MLSSYVVKDQIFFPKCEILLLDIEAGYDALPANMNSARFRGAMVAR